MFGPSHVARGYRAWCEAHGLAPFPAPASQVAAYLNEVEAAGGPLARRWVAGQLAGAFRRAGVPFPLALEHGPIAMPAGNDYGTQVTMAHRIGAPSGLSLGWSYPPARQPWADVLVMGALARAYRRVEALQPDDVVRIYPERVIERSAKVREAEQGARGWFRRTFGKRDDVAGLGAIVPTIGNLTIPEAEAMLSGLVARNVAEIRAGAPMPSPLIRSGRLRYIRRDPDEQWLSLGDMLAKGGGDCEDLASAVAAERSILGKPSRVRIVRTGPRTAHAIVEDARTGQRFDPSLTAGMGWDE